MELKRVIDVSLAAVCLVFSSPVCIAAAIAIRANSSGPVLFRQERVGQDGRIFRIRKFRTMWDGRGGPAVSAAGDRRVTHVGRILRKSKLDELPQLLDVLEGHMSFVGPRPEVPEYVALWPEADRAVILSVRPGITDPASILYRNEAEELAAVEEPVRYYSEVILPRKVALYVEYVRTRTIFGDFKILLATFRAVITR